MGEKKIKPPKLPAKAPKELKDFLACKSMEVDLDPAQAGWIPKPELVPEGLVPTVTPTPNGANNVDVAVGWGFVSLKLPVSVAGGLLNVDAANLPGKQAIDDWVTAFNDSLKANGKELAGLELKDGKIHLTKRVIAATTPTQTTTTPTEPIPTTPPPATTPTPSETPPAKPEGDGLKPGCLVGILICVVLFLGAGIAFLVTRGGDDDKQAAATTVAATAAPTTTEEPIDETQICARTEILQQVLADFGTDDPCTIDPADFWEACDELFMPCFKGGVPLIVLSPTVGVTHDGSLPDTVTGDTAPSQAEHLVQVVGPLADATASVDVTSACGNHEVNGTSPLLPTGLTSILHPLRRFGDCRADVYYRTATTRQLIGSYDYPVSEAVAAAGPPAIDGITVPTDTSLNDAGTSLGLLGGKPLDLACTWFSTQSNPSTLAQCLGDRWAFNAAYGDPRIDSYGAGWINPLGVAAPTADQIAPVGASRLFGAGTLFPCGPGHFGYTACAKDEATVASSSFVAVTVSWSSRLDEMPVGTYVQVGIADYSVRLLREADSWTLTSSEGDGSQARAILRGDAITFMIPFDGTANPDPTYTVTVGDDTGEVAQAPQPVVGVVTSTQGPELPSDFFAQLSSSIATGDLTFALERLHPLVLEAFPGDVCHTELSLRVAPDYAITVNSVGEMAPWTWELPDGRAYEVDAATTVSILLPGSTDPVDSHLVNIDRKYFWFTVCDGR
ncbi:MAG: hypothetical protein K8R99_14685 [Actinomycetia bacterium]|nr:hypothetical protein [Actinomycetes bacterium]